MLLPVVPPAIIPEVFPEPPPPAAYLAVFNSETSVQLDPSQDSTVFDPLGGDSPAATIAELGDPKPVLNEKELEASFTSVQLLPFQFSVFPLTK